MTDEQIEQLIEHGIPELRVALKSMLREHMVCHAFDFAVGTNAQTGIQSKIVVIMALEPVAMLLENCARGVKAMEDCIVRLQSQAKGKSS